MLGRDVLPSNGDEVSLAAVGIDCDATRLEVLIRHRTREALIAAIDFYKVVSSPELESGSPGRAQGAADRAIAINDLREDARRLEIRAGYRRMTGRCTPTLPAPL